MRCAGSRYIAACPFGLVLGRREAEVRKTFFVLVCQPIAKMPPQVVLGADPIRRHRRLSRDGDEEAGIATEIRAFSNIPVLDPDIRKLHFCQSAHLGYGIFQRVGCHHEASLANAVQAKALSSSSCGNSGSWWRWLQRQ